ncbi:MAG: hypothetical protein AAF579_06375 [Cyanobacteria bacterium P01_C01_bin.118]
MTQSIATNLISDTVLVNSEPLNINPKKGHFVFANRNSGDLSILQETNGNVMGTIDTQNFKSVHYDDGDSASLGFSDYGWIQDFSLNQQDIIRLHGSADMYELGSIGGSTAIFYKGTDQTAELVGIVQNVVGLDLASNAFEYATA